MNSLSPPDTQHLKAAEGWLELGNHLDANEELDNITPALRSYPDVLALRWQIYAKVKQWEVCVDIARAIAAADPSRVEGWINRSFALHELKRTEEALDALEPAVEHFPKDWTVRYNLACYACQLGNHDEAWAFLTQAVDMAGTDDVKSKALDDPDLEPLWAEIGEI